MSTLPNTARMVLTTSETINRNAIPRRCDQRGRARSHDRAGWLGARRHSEGNAAARRSQSYAAALAVIEDVASPSSGTPSFRRFVRDNARAVVYETEVASDSRFHFVSWGDIAGLLYHCRSDKKGADSIEAVDRMLEGCHAISARDRVAGPGKNP
jgi:hypothetical protein